MFVKICEKLSRERFFNLWVDRPCLDFLFSQTSGKQCLAKVVLTDAHLSNSEAQRGKGREGVRRHSEAKGGRERVG